MSALAIIVILAFGVYMIKCTAPMRTGATSAQIISEYAAFIERHGYSPLKIEDVSVLPYPKDVILSALLNAVTPGQKNKNDWLHSGALFLAQYQRGVGSEPLYSDGFDMTEFLRQRPPTKDPDALRALAKEMCAAMEKGKKTAAMFEEFDKLVNEDLREISAKFAAIGLPTD